MKIEKMQEKIIEWKVSQSECSTKTLKTLMQQTVDLGENIKVLYEELLDEFFKNIIRFNVINNEFDLIIATGDGEKYAELLGINITSQMEALRKEMEIKQAQLRDSDEVKDLANNLLQTMSFDEIIEFYGNLAEQLKCSNKAAQEKIQTFRKEIIEVQRETMCCIFGIYIFMFKTCDDLIDASFDYHDYGRWEKIKNEIGGKIKDAILSVNAIVDISESLIKSIFVFDKASVRKDFYSETENNIAKIEGQLEALNLTKTYIEMSIQQYQKREFDMFARK